MNKYTQLAKLINYPQSDFKELTNFIIDTLSIGHPEVGEYLQSYKDAIEQLDLDQIREAYTTTFDLQQVCSLDVGYVIFGEDYKRGEFLVQVQRLCREHQLDVGSELPDHMPNMLRLLPLLEQGLQAELVEKILYPAVEKMLDILNQGNSEKNYFSLPLKVIAEVFIKDFKIVKSKSLYGGDPCS